VKANYSVCFRTSTKEHHFLFQALNLGESGDDLKFVFTDPASGVGGTYTVNRDRYGKGDLVRLVPEITYHPDGSLLFKMPRYSKRTTTEYINPQQVGFRRTPLAEIGQWEGFLLYRVHNYTLCKKKDPSNPIYLTIAPSWFDGTPFECRFFLGHKECPTPIPSEEILVERLTGLSDRIDLVLAIAKIQERGFKMRLGDSDQYVFSTNNVIELIPHNRGASGQLTPTPNRRVTRLALLVGHTQNVSHK
jgi:hypothetical protein